jgi:hypothetical protein
MERYRVRNHDQILTRCQRNYRKLSPEQRQAKLDYKRAWRKANREKIRAQKRRAALRQPARTREYMAEYRARRRAERADVERRRYHGEITGHPCRTPGCTSVLTGMRKKCDACLEAMSREAERPRDTAGTPVRMCADHWAMLRAEVERVGLGAYVAKSGQEAFDSVVRTIEGKDTPWSDFDPLLNATLAIYGQYTTDVGLEALIREPDGSDPCPLCGVRSNTDAAGADGLAKVANWIQGSVADELGRAQHFNLPIAEPKT